MPYKDINKRREAWRKWYKKNRYNPIVIAKKKARDIAYRNINSQQCSIVGCKNIGERHHGNYKLAKDVIFLCKRHHEDIHSIPKCKLCNKPHSALGLCYNHWRQQHRRLYGRK